MNIWDEVKSLKIGTAIPKVEEGKSAKWKDTIKVQYQNTR